MQSTTTTKGWHRREAQQNPKSPLPRASRLLAQSPPGIGRKRPSLPGQLPGDRASAVPLQLPQMRPVGAEPPESDPRSVEIAGIPVLDFETSFAGSGFEQLGRWLPLAPS